MLKPFLILIINDNNYVYLNIIRYNLDPLIDTFCFDFIVLY